MGIEKRGLMFHPGSQHPVSRDWALEDHPCQASKCAANVCGLCISPANAVIGEDGKCKGYHPRKAENDGADHDSEKTER